MLPQKLKGTVTRFKGDGRKLGYPTANIKVETDLQDGVYFGRADLANYKKHSAVIFIGTPTTMGGTGRRVEAHLLDIPDSDYYEQTMTLSIEHYHRPNITFPNLDSLMGAIQADDAAARLWLDK